MPSLRLRVLLPAGLIAAFLGIAAPASACPLTNPNCVIDKVEETADDAVHDVDETLDRVREEADRTVDDVKETVDQVEETVAETVDPPPGPTAPPPPTEPPGPGPRDPSPRDPKRDPKVKGDDANRSSDEGDGDGAALGPSPIDPPSNLLLPSALRIVAADDPAGPEESVGESALEAAKTFAFPLIMTLLVGIFVVVQHRVDRRDPKFVLAPVEHELLSFE